MSLAPCLFQPRDFGDINLDGLSFVRVGKWEGTAPSREPQGATTSALTARLLTRRGACGAGDGERTQQHHRRRDGRDARLVSRHGRAAGDIRGRNSRCDGINAGRCRPPPCGCRAYACTQECRGGDCAPPVELRDEMTAILDATLPGAEGLTITIVY